MEHSWHQPPPLPPPRPGGPSLHGTICPVCSVSHFPFCPPPYTQNHHIHQYPPPHPNQFHPGPQHQPQHPAPSAYDPFVDHHSGSVMNPYHPPADLHGPWNASSSAFSRDPYSNMYPGSGYNYAGARRPEFDDSSNIGAKRMKFDDPGYSSGPTAPYMSQSFINPSSFSADDERRLKLIRDHGGLMNGDAGMNYGEQKDFDGRTDLGFNPFKNIRNPTCGDADKKAILYSQENNINMRKHGEEQFGQEHRTRNRNVEHVQSQYDQADRSWHRSNEYGYIGNPRDSHNSLKEPKQSHETMGYNWQGASGASAVYNDHKSGFAVGNHDLHYQFSQKQAMQRHIEPKSCQYGSPFLNNQGGNLLNGSEMNMGQGRDSQVYDGQPPLPASPPPPLPVEPLGQHSSEPLVSPSPSVASSSLFPVSVASSAVAPSSYPFLPETSSLPSLHYPNKSHLHASSGFDSEEYLDGRQASCKTHLEEGASIPLWPLSPDTPKIIDASHIIKHPHRANRPDHIVIILRGLPGSGKSYLAKMLRDLEVENGGNVPRIHSMDDYFMTEVEKIEESESSKSSGSARGKKQIAKEVIEYCYEPEMEEAYRSSMLKAFKKTLDEGVFSFVIVDDRNLRVADFAQFWATAKRSGYEVYLLEAAYKDPVGCAARNVHGFAQDVIQKMADVWEEAPSLYLKLDIKPLLHGDGLEENGIQEVDMDMEDGDLVDDISVSDARTIEKVVTPKEGGVASDGPKEDKRWDAETDHSIGEVKELGKSKWSNYLDEDDIHKNEASKRNLHALSGLRQSYSTEGKSVRWGDEVGNSGFSIAAAKTANSFSLVIGPGAGYNLKSNPSLEEEVSASRNMSESKKQSMFQERLRAERESFRTVFDKRRQRIGGFDVDDE